MSTTLVEMFNNQPMTTSLAIADGIEMSHKQVIAMVRKYINELSEFNPIGFEIRMGDSKSYLKSDLGGEVAFQTRLNAQGSPTEYALLNEGQAMFLLTLQKNSPKVVQFKLALVKAFLEMRDRLTQTAPHTNTPLTLSHRADIRVAADRTFRSVLRACRSAGTKLPQALKRANEITLHETGIDVMSDYQIDMPAPATQAYKNHLKFLDAWMANELPVPCVPCRSTDLYQAYCHWGMINHFEIMPINQVNADISAHCGFKKSTVRILGVGCGMAKVVTPIGNWANRDKSVEFSNYVQQFSSALQKWINA